MRFRLRTLLPVFLLLCVAAAVPVTRKRPATMECRTVGVTSSDGSRVEIGYGTRSNKLAMLLNHNDVLSAREANNDASFIEQYIWAWHAAGLTLPIHPPDYYSLAREANGNTTFVIARPAK